MITTVCMAWIAFGFITRHVTMSKPQPISGVGALATLVCWIIPSAVLVAVYWP